MVVVAVVVVVVVQLRRLSAQEGVASKNKN
jgi:hypothetical protein